LTASESSKTVQQHLHIKDSLNGQSSVPIGSTRHQLWQSNSRTQPPEPSHRTNSSVPFSLPTPRGKIGQLAFPPSSLLSRPLAALLLPDSRARALPTARSSPRRPRQPPSSCRERPASPRWPFLRGARWWAMRSDELAAAAPALRGAEEEEEGGLVLSRGGATPAAPAPRSR